MGLLLKRGLVVVVSIALSLALAESGARLLHRGAFPYLNLFRADARYGVVLAPSSSARVRSRDGRVTAIETNALGFRGAEWRAPRVLVVGDSQVMGYGVAWAETLAPQLSQALGVEVGAAAVPSWGPEESVRAIEDLTSRVRPQRVVFVVNAANDWFEAGVPNVRRTSARDGWAASPESARVRRFPGREFLLGRSHLVFAARELFEGGRRLLAGEALPADTALRLDRDLESLSRGPHSRITSAIRAADRLCRARGCELVVAALPLDVQVSTGEWAKYRAQPFAMTRTERLLDDVVRDARAMGLRAVNLLPMLRAAEPGAFLPDDYHLSARGHAACARAIADLLNDKLAVKP